MTLVFRLSVTLVFVVAATLGFASAQSGSGTGRKSRGTSAKAGKKPKSTQPAVSTFETRRADWIRRKEAASTSGTTGPDPLEQYLVSEVLVTGLFETDTGFGVFLHATPTGNTFFATNGAKLFNGRLLTIEKVGGGFGDDAQIVFEERTGKGSPQRIVKRVVAVPSKVEMTEPPPSPSEKPTDAPKEEKSSGEKPPLDAY